MRCEFRVVEAGTGASAVLAVSVPDGASLDDVKRAVEPYVGAGRRLFCHGREVAGPGPATDVGLCDGVLVGLDADVTEQLPPSGLRLLVESGPSAGWSIPLGVEPVVVGRDPSCGIRLDDRNVSRQQCRLTPARDSSGPLLSVEDLDSANGTGIDGYRIKGSTQLRPGQVLTAGSSRLGFAADRPPDLETLPGPDGSRLVKFQKRVDLHPLPGQLKVTWPAPPRKQEPQRFPVIALIVPLVFALGMALVMRQVYMLAFALMSPVMGVANHLSEKKRRTGQDGKSEEEHEDAVRRERARMDDAARRELQIHRARWPSVAETVEACRLTTGRLWQRQLDDEDALEVRLGVADLPSRSVVVEPTQGAEAPGPPVLHGDPVGISLTEARVLGVQGPDEAVRALVRSLLLQLVTYQAPNQLTVSAILRDGGQTDFEWIRWLPHAHVAQAVMIGNTPPTVEAQLNALSEMVAGRRHLREESRGAMRFPVHVAVVEDSGAYDPSLMGPIFEHGPDVGVHCIVAERKRSQLPKECRIAVNLAAAAEGSGWSCHVELPGGASIDQVHVELVDPRVADTAARSLAPLRPMAGDGDRSGSIPESLRFLDHQGIRNADAGEIARRWRANPSSSRGVVGESATGPASFDFAQTPHGFVGGTTGAGKSQLLITMVASLALVNSPEDLNFVLVDFKGGGAFHRCAELPHTVAMITNLSGDVERTVESLAIELERREALFRPYDASLTTYEAARRRDPSIGPKVARLVVVIDEFAEFIGGHDDLEDRIGTLARKGRSPGVNLVLGTQAPSQAIRPKIDAQLEMGIALRLKDPSESLHVIKDPIAASLPVDPRGRAFMRTAGAPLEFQVSTLGLPLPGDSAGEEVLVVHRPWADVGAPPAWPERRTSSMRDGTTDLDLFVDTVIEAGRLSGISAQASPVLPLLPEAVAVSGLWGAGHPEAMWVEEHLREQRQVAAGWCPEDGNLLVPGSPGSGRTTMLRTIAGMLASTRSPADLHLHVFDFEGSLGALEELPHVGTVAGRNDLWRTERLVGWLREEMGRRRQLFADRRVGSLDEFRQHGGSLPRIVVLVDRWEFLGDNDEWSGVTDALMAVLKEGAPLGITTVLATDGKRSFKLLDAVSSVVALRLADRGEYGNVLADSVRPRDLPESIPPGRAFRMRPTGVDGVELTPLQAAHLGDSPQTADQNEGLAALATRVPPAFGDEGPHRIGALPYSISLAQLPQPVGPGPGPLAVPVGVGGDDLSVVWCDLSVQRSFVVAGPQGSGRSASLASMRSWLVARGTPTEIVIPDQLFRRAGVSGARPGSEATAEWVASLPADSVLFVDDVDQLDGDETLDALAQLVRGGPGPCVILSADAETLRGGYGTLARALGSVRCGLLLHPSRAYNDVLGLKLGHITAVTGPPGRGIAVVDGVSALVQAPTPEG